MADKRREKLNQFLTDVATKNNRINELFDAADRRGDGVNTSEEIAEIKRLNAEIEPLAEQIAEMKSVMGIRDAAAGRSRELTDPAGQSPFNGGNGGGDEHGNGRKSVGQIFLESDQYKDWMKSVAPGGRIPEKVSINCPPVEVKTLLTGASSTSGGPLVFPDFTPIVDSAYKRPLTVRDLITNSTTGSDTVEYVRQTAPTNNAAAVAEATATGDASGQKPESAMGFTRVTEPVSTIAHWVAATNRAIADAGQLRTYIDDFLRYGIEEELEDQILTGNNAGENFDGVLHVSGTTAQAFATNVLTTTRKGRTKVRVTGRAMATAFVMHPNDWEAIDLLQDNEARYYYGGPAQMGNPRLWGLPVVESEGMTEGFAVVADWRLAILWDRMATTISMSNSHSDFFTRNLVAILGEMRAAFGIIRPAAFVICDLTA